MVHVPDVQVPQVDLLQHELNRYWLSISCPSDAVVVGELVVVRVRMVVEFKVMEVNVLWLSCT